MLYYSYELNLSKLRKCLKYGYLIVWRLRWHEMRCNSAPGKRVMKIAMTRNAISHGVRGSLTLFHDLFVLCVLYKTTSRLVSIAIEPLFNELLCQDIPPARQIQCNLHYEFYIDYQEELLFGNESVVNIITLYENLHMIIFNNVNC